MCQFKINSENTNIAEFIKNNREEFPKKKEQWCKFCGGEMPHHIYGTAENSRGVAYACVRCGTTPFGVYDAFMTKCEKCGESRPHFTDYDCGTAIYVCGACGDKHVDPSELKLMKSLAADWEKYQDPEDHQAEHAWCHLQDLIERGIVKKDEEKKE